MKALGIFEVKNRLSEVCEEVATQGDPLVITRHGKPLVRIVPYEEALPSSSVWGSVEECRARYGALEDDFQLPVRDLVQNRKDPLG